MDATGHPQAFDAHPTAAARCSGTTRAEVGPTLPAADVDAVLRVYEYEGSRAAATERAVRLVETALDGERWEPRL